ncbi:MAG: redoxin domain-containing protein [Deltaproteobacteria bacterium]|nr:redoxin domain-containing protein [Deltaproteobacteria bacterium]
MVVAGLGLSALGVRHAYQQRRGGRRLAPVLGLLNFSLCGFLVWHLFVASYRLPPAANAPAVGTAAPDFELQNERGELVRLSSLRGRNVVLLFYRGFW